MKSIEELVKESKIFDKRNPPSSDSEVFISACECLSFIIKMRSSELIHIVKLDDEEKELTEEDIECAILKAFIDCKRFLLYAKIALNRSAHLYSNNLNFCLSLWL